MRVPKPKGNGPRTIDENVKWNGQPVAEALIKRLSSQQNAFKETLAERSPSLEFFNLDEFGFFGKTTTSAIFQWYQWG